MTIPDRTLDAVAMLYAEAIVALRDGDWAAAREAHDAAGALQDNAEKDAALAGPWAGQAKVSA